MQALGKTVECNYCLSVFDSFDGAEDAGEASDSAEEWALGKSISQTQTELENVGDASPTEFASSETTDSQRMISSIRPK